MEHDGYKNYRPQVHLDPAGGNKWLGRFQSLDLRSYGYRYRDRKEELPAPKEAPKLERYWNIPEVLPLDQGPHPWCVGFSIATCLIMGPVTQPTLRAYDKAQAMAEQIYRKALTLDEFEGEQDAGTSVNAGMKAAAELKYIKSWLWAYTLDEMNDFILTRGPVVMGTVWPDSMMDARDTDGLLIVKDDSSLTGPHAAGHAWCVNGVSKKKKLYRMEQTWGQWGKEGSGKAYISFDDMEKLLHINGECALPTEVKLPAPKKAAA